MRNEWKDVHLTQEQKELLSALLRARQECGTMPTVRELSRTTGVSSFAVVQARLHELEALGIVALSPGRARGVQLCAAPEEAALLLSSPEGPGGDSRLDRETEERMRMRRSTGDEEDCLEMLQMMLPPGS